MDRKSYSRNTTYLNGDLVDRSTHKQHDVALSFTKTEYIAVSDVYKDDFTYVIS